MPAGSGTRGTGIGHIANLGNSFAMNKTMACTAQPFHFKVFRVIGMVGFGLSMLMASFAIFGRNPFTSAEHNLYGLAGFSFGEIFSFISQKYFVPVPIVALHSHSGFVFPIIFIVRSIPFVVMVAVFLCGISLMTVVFEAFFTHRTNTELTSSIFVEMRKRFGLMTGGAFLHGDSIQQGGYACLHGPHYEQV